MNTVLVLTFSAAIGLIAPSLSNGLLTEFSCNFNDGNLCSLNQQVDDAFDWTIQQGPTPTRGTGPSRDHGDGAEGFYIYIEASDPRVVNENARLSSGVCEPGIWSLNFYFHAVGNHIGSLTVYAKAENTNYHRLVWFYSARMNATLGEWTKAEIFISEASPFQVVFEGLMNIGAQNDIALDDITASMTDSAVISNNHQPHNLPIACDFEEGNQCSFISHYRSQNDWILHKGPTDSTNTGPSVDHTKGTAEGFYIYIESSFHFVDIRTIIATTIFWPACGCFTVDFWYHAYGSSVKKLMLIQEGYDVPLWAMNVVSRDEWIHVNNNYTTSHPTSLLFVGVLGDDHTCDYALDDISVLDCGCPSTQAPATMTALEELPVNISCDFNNGNISPFYQQTDDAFDWTIQQSSANISGLGGKVEGYYITVNGSQPWVKTQGTTIMVANKQTRIASSWLKGGEWKLNFSYVAYGDLFGHLIVYTKAQNSNYYNLAWVCNSILNESAAGWRNAEVVLAEAENFQIVFEGAVGVRPQGEISVDDITAFRTGTIQPVFPHESYGLPLQCDFNNTSCCSDSAVYDYQLYSKQLSWTLGQGNTPTFLTGPDKDRNTQTAEGYYLYLEASHPAKLGWRCILATSTFWSSCGSVIVKFSFSAYGDSIGMFLLMQEGYSLPLWTTRGQNHWNWIDVELNVSTTHPTKLLFIGEVGDGVYGDVGLDAISITDSPCTTNNDSKKLSTPSEFSREQEVCSKVLPIDVTSVKHSTTVQGLKTTSKSVMLSSTTTTPLLTAVQSAAASSKSSADVTKAETDVVSSPSAKSTPSLKASNSVRLLSTLPIVSLSSATIYYTSTYLFI